jgi:hypothetical protein
MFEIRNRLENVQNYKLFKSEKVQPYSKLKHVQNLKMFRLKKSKNTDQQKNKKKTQKP